MNRLRPLGKSESGLLHLSDYVCTCLVAVSLSVSHDWSMLTVLATSLTVSSWATAAGNFRHLDKGSMLRGWPCQFVALAAYTVLFVNLKTTEHAVMFGSLGLICLVLHPVLLAVIIEAFPKSFTFGEASVVCQGIILMFYSGIKTIFMYISTYNSLAQLTNGCIDWIWDVIDHCTSRTAIYLILSWLVLSVMSLLIVAAGHHFNWVVGTKTRKIFHLMAGLVYISGLQHDALLLYYASIGATVVFVLVELVRRSNLFPWMTREINKVLLPFLDEKDGGSLILTHIYLLIGVSIPLWIWPHHHVSPAQLPLYAGVLSVGVGDTFASLIGSCYGRVKWPRSNKTVEGSVAAFLSILLGIVVIIGTEPLSKHVYAYLAGILATVVFEGCCDQVDNLTLPFILYCGLILASGGASPESSSVVPIVEAILQASPSQDPGMKQDL